MRDLVSLKVNLTTVFVWYNGGKFLTRLWESWPTSNSMEHNGRSARGPNPNVC